MGIVRWLVCGSMLVVSSGCAALSQIDAPPAVEANTTTVAPASTTTAAPTTVPRPPRDNVANPKGCEGQEFFVDRDVGWVVDANTHTLTACRNNTPISSATWSGGMGEVFYGMDSNRDGIDEVVVGGTSAGGGGGTVFSLIDDTVLPVLLEDGSELLVTTGRIADSFDETGCRDGQLVQIVLTASHTTAVARRTFMTIARDRAVVTDVETIDWELDTPIVDSFELYGVWAAGPALSADLESCA